MKYLKITLGFILLPLFVLLFTLDRVTLIFLWWITGVPIQKWIYDPLQATFSLIRVVAFLLLHIFFKLILS
jgi:hypothetical protein